MKALLQVAGDVFDNHNGVIDHESCGNRERHQREIVDTVAQQVHDPKGAHQRNWNHHAGDDGGPDIAQEGEHDQDDEGHGDHERELDILHRGANRHGSIQHDGKLDGGGDCRLQLRQGGLYDGKQPALGDHNFCAGIVPLID